MSHSKTPLKMSAVLILLLPFRLDGEDSLIQLTLKHCVQLAIAQSEQLQISAEEIAQSREHIRQATGAILPNLKWNNTDIIQDTNGVDGSSGGVGGTLTKRSRNESKFVVKQPLFSGFKEFSARSGFKADMRKFEKQLERGKMALLGQTAETFFGVVLSETERKNLQTLIKLTQDRIEELRGRVNLGKSRSSEVISAESQLASLKAQLASTEGQIVSARDDLGFLIGQDVRNSLLVDVTPRPSEISDEKDTLLFVQNRSDIQALREKVVSKRYAVKVAKSGFWPKADLLGDYYTHRTGFQKEIDWDVTFNLDVPLYQGGNIKSQSREAASRLRQAELELENLTRQVGTEIRRTRSNLNSSVIESQILEEAFDKAKQSYDMQVKEYRLGLVNNLEVLQAMNSMQDARQKLDRALLQSKLHWLRLQIALEQEI